MGWSLEGRRALVTGGASGIGRETSRLLAERGVRVAVLDANGEGAAAVAEEIASGAFALAVDVRDRSAVEAAVAEAAARLGGLDVALANAGLGHGGFLRWQDGEEWEAVVDVNLLGVARTARAVLPRLVDSRGYLLLTASLAAAVHSPGMSAYAASKAGVEAMGNALRLEVRHLGVDVGVAYYSRIGTPMVEAADAHPIYGRRRAARGLARRTYDVADAARATVAGIEARSERVAYPPWVKPALMARTLLLRRRTRDALAAAAAETDRLAEQAAARDP